MPETSEMNPPRKRQRLEDSSAEEDTSSDELSLRWNTLNSETTPTQASYATRTKGAVPHRESAQRAVNSTINPEYQTSSVRIAKECLQTIGGFITFGHEKDNDSDVTATAAALQRLSAKLNKM